MSDSWEERMSQRAWSRTYAARTAQRAKEEAPHLPEAHRGHHTHIARGGFLDCSCGERFDRPAIEGLFAVDDGQGWACSACGAPDVLLNAPPVMSFSLNDYQP